MYEALLNQCTKENILVQERDIEIKGGIKGLYAENVIWINKRIKSIAEKSCILAEELGHHYTSFGDILDQKDMWKRKQEVKAREWAYERLVPLNKIVQAQKQGITNRFELAEYLGVTEDFLQNALDRYKEKYGIYTFVNGHRLFFDPLRVG
ncbi:ImmA/IrrE family metallo-endopeptidase [Bacillus sp. FSL K6-0138]|uniref:ImmA/IrrE family metallo-endopeptidase n=1 Tax=Bacillus TaxID=1386 RepID=UPI00263B3671|nr:ImmA/IrrE family metallo-endopeptidase [Bacillus glycinifermentans]WKB77929.1 ImmA/IrrE family metallo-endopeptidase [Bacillus glycinifermentans]